MRLDRYISEQLVVSRSHATALIRSGRVTVDGEQAKRAGQPVRPGTSQVACDDNVVPWLAHITLVMHKPAGLVTARLDAGEPTILELVPPQWLRPSLAPAGRLDKDTTGLLILTTDGQLNHFLTHPTRHLPKVYVANVAGDALLDADPPQITQAFADGITLADGTLCRPAGFRWRQPGLAEITLSEGRTHQVKRMVAASGGRVLTLHRESIGGLKLPADIDGGSCRLITDDELARLQSSSRPD